MQQKNIGIYIHIPYCKSKCAYCDFVSFSDFSTQQQYLGQLLKEIDQRSATGFKDGKEKIEEKGQRLICDSIYIGGGTPSVFLRGGISQIADRIRQSFDVLDSLEFTVEANPESCSDDFLSECVAAKVNRLSIGLQSCHDSILKNAKRRHNYSDFLKAFYKAREFGINNISIDLIMGLEGEKKSTFSHSLQRVLELSPEHISIYALKCEKGTRLFDSGFVVDEDLICDLYDHAVDRLTSAGYNRYEVSNFSKSGFESRHNQKYWRLFPYLGFGIAAHSYYDGIRRANTASMHDYLCGNHLEELTDVREDEKEEFVMLGLRLEQGISLEEYQKRFGCSLLETHQKQIARLQRDGQILIHNNHLKIHPNHLYVMNQIILELI